MPSLLVNPALVGVAYFERKLDVPLGDPGIFIWEAMI